MSELELNPKVWISGGTYHAKVKATGNLPALVQGYPRLRFLTPIGKVKLRTPKSNLIVIKISPAFPHPWARLAGDLILEAFPKKLAKRVEIQRESLLLNALTLVKLIETDSKRELFFEASNKMSSIKIQVWQHL